MKLPMPEYQPGPYIPIFEFDEFRKRIMVSFGYAAGYDGVSQDDNPGKADDERAWWLEGWNLGAAIFEVFTVSKPLTAPPVASSVDRPAQSKSRNLF